MRIEGTQRAEGAEDATAKARMAKLADGAHQFEAMMLQEMLKGLNFGDSAEGGGKDGDTGGAGGTLQSYGTESLAKAITAGGGFGLARQIVRQVTAEDHAKVAGGITVSGSKAQ